MKDSKIGEKERNALFQHVAFSSLSPEKERSINLIERDIIFLFYSARRTYLYFDPFSFRSHDDRSTFKDQNDIREFSLSYNRKTFQERNDNASANAAKLRTYESDENKRALIRPLAPGKNARVISFIRSSFSFSLDRYEKDFFLLLPIRSVKRSKFARESIF